MRRALFLGRLLPLEMSNVPANGLPLGVLIGFGPFDIPIGGQAPGCSLLTENLLPITTSNLLGGAYLDLPMPSHPLFLGATLTVQGASLAPGENSLGVIFSNGLALTLGEF